MTAVALGQLDRLKSLPGGPEGLVNLVKDCPIIAEVHTLLYSYSCILLLAEFHHMQCIYFYTIYSTSLFGNLAVWI